MIVSLDNWHPCGCPGAQDDLEACFEKENFSACGFDVRRTPCTDLLQPYRRPLRLGGCCAADSAQCGTSLPSFGRKRHILLRNPVPPAREWYPSSRTSGNLTHRGFLSDKRDAAHLRQANRWTSNYLRCKRSKRELIQQPLTACKASGHRG